METLNVMEEEKVCKCTVPDFLQYVRNCFPKTFTCTDGPAVRKFTLWRFPPPQFSE